VFPSIDPSAAFIGLVSPFVWTLCWCWRERSRRKTIKEILPELHRTNPAIVREISRLLISRRWRREDPPASRLEVVQPPHEIKPPAAS
jgi:hypothetical protein